MRAQKVVWLILLEKEGERKSTVIKIKAMDGNMSLVQELYYFLLKDSLIHTDKIIEFGQ